MKQSISSVILLSSLLILPFAGCESLPGNDANKDVVAGGFTNTPRSQPKTGGHFATDDKVVGGLLGADGGFLIGQQPDKNDRAEAQLASDQAQKSPASPAQARQSATADLNKDGFVTLDEVVAMRDAGLDDQQMIHRLQATGQVFFLTQSQADYLLNHGLNRTVVNALLSLHQPTTTP
ncbi:MAG TPA: hypothetical protein VGN12_19635 [Pirellulales bacterium]|jgi:hypothetical protein